MDPHKLHELQTQQILDAKFAAGRLENLSLHEKLEGLSEITSFQERVLTLRANSERSFNTILHYTFGDFKWKLTPEDIKSIEYMSSDDSDPSIQGMNLIKEARRLYVFLEDSAATKERLIEILTEMFENLHEDEVKILKGMFEGKLPYKNVTKKLVATAFPDLFPDFAEEVKTPKGKSKNSEPGSTTASVEKKENK